MRLLWPDIIFSLENKARPFATAIINDTDIITIWKKEICPGKSIINHQMFLGLFREVLCLLSLMTSPLREWLALLLMVAFNYLQGISKLWYFILKWPEEHFLIVFFAEQRSHSGESSNPDGFVLKKMTRNPLQLALLVVRTLVLIKWSKQCMMMLLSLKSYRNNG